MTHVEFITGKITQFDTVTSTISTLNLMTIITKTILCVTKLFKNNIANAFMTKISMIWYGIQL